MDLWADPKLALPCTRLRTIIAVLTCVALNWGCGGSSNSQKPAAPSISTQPTSQSVMLGQPATFAVVATGTGTLNYQWQKNGTAIVSGATSSTYTTPPTVASDTGAQFRVVVSNSAGQVISNPATLTVLSTSAVDVVTYHNDSARTGQNLKESTLTPANVNFSNFGKLAFFNTDGKVDAQPLYLSSLNVAGGTHNVLYVVSEHGSVYALDADSGTVLWQASLIGAGETPSDDRGCSQITPEIGITSTPVIDRTAGTNGAIYVVAMSKNATGAYFQRLHALDITSGAELFGGPVTVQASFPGTGANSSGGNVIFDAKQYAERAGLLLLNGTIYTTWTSHCDIGLYTGWIIAYNAKTLVQSAVLNVTPNGSEGAIWMAGTAPAADSANNIYFLDANGTFDTTLTASGFPVNGDFGNSFIKLSTSNGLAVADYFAVSNTVAESNADEDLGSGGALVLPDLTDNSGQTWHLAVGAGKDTNLYVVNRDHMGKFNATSNNIHQELSGALPGGVFSMPAYFNNTIYYGSVGGTIKAFAISNAHLSTTPTSQTGIAFTYPGSTPSISANGNNNGIVWAHENTSPAVLHAYDATNLNHELYNSSQAGTRDQFGPGNKFITPTIANGKVYVGTTNGVAVFGLLH
jgi:outer membrane protein assembly factor BamB